MSSQLDSGPRRGPLHQTVAAATILVAESTAIAEPSGLRRGSGLIVDCLVDREVDPQSPVRTRPVDPWTPLVVYAPFHAFTRGGALTTRCRFPNLGRLPDTHSIERPRMVK